MRAHEEYFEMIVEMAQEDLAGSTRMLGETCAKLSRSIANWLYGLTMTPDAAKWSVTTAETLV